MFSGGLLRGLGVFGGPGLDHCGLAVYRAGIQKMKKDPGPSVWAAWVSIPNKKTRALAVPRVFGR